MIGFLQRTKAFSIPLLILVGILSVLLIFFNKVEIELWVNAYNSAPLDFFFRYFTNLGDGITAFIVSLIFMVFNIKRGLLLLLTFIISGLFIQYLKIHIFPDIVRPVTLLKGTYVLHLVEGVKMGEIQSFPSGHTGTAFAMFFCLATFTNKTWLHVSALVTAVLIGFSRIYLCQHFLPDVIAGAVIGTFTSLVLLTLFEHNKTFMKLNHPIFPRRASNAEKDT
ncbi:MAG TPA: phosphatase PAP2 family protein [Prolixibacteraceae bacterium]